MNQESVRMLSRVAFCGIKRALQADINVWYPPSLQLPTNKWRSAGPGCSCCLLSITGLQALGWAKWYGRPLKLPSPSMFWSAIIQARLHGVPGQTSVYVGQWFGRIQRKTWGVWDPMPELTRTSPVPSNIRLQHIWHGKPYARVDLSTIPASSLSPSQGLWIYILCTVSVS
jgi:hypothetical protein